MAKIYFYKLTADSGGAPCIQDGLLSLAICKPMIRSAAKPGDWIFGFAAKSLRTDNPLLYIARVAEKPSSGEYYTAKKFKRREDCIYERRGNRFVWREGALHHGPEHLVHDLGEHPEYSKASVLLSNDFRYFGANGSAEYKARYSLIKDAVEHLGRGHRSRHDEPLRMELEALKQEIWNGTRKKVLGAPTSKPRRGACHRSRSCGVVGDDAVREQ
ncbi:hypothetical protein HY522_04015 [bacterium]|nr:hypothetical protein [bacterium]